MSYNSDLCKLVIENVALVEAAQNVLVWIDEQLVKKIWEYIGSQLQEQDFFAIGQDTTGNNFFWDKSWGKKEDGVPLARFWLDCQGSGCSDRSWLAVLGGLVPGTVGGLFLWYEWNTKGIKKRDWKAFLHDFFIQNPRLQANGFVLNDEGTAIIKPLKFDLLCLADNFQNPQSCMDVISDSMEAIYAERTVFEKLLNQAEKIGSAHTGQ